MGDEKPKQEIDEVKVQVLVHLQKAINLLTNGSLVTTIQTLQVGSEGSPLLMSILASFNEAFRTVNGEEMAEWMRRMLDED
jgi:hypothetical protein